MTTVAHVARALQTVLTTTADATGRSSGFIQRQRTLTGASFVQGLVAGWLAHPTATWSFPTQPFRAMHWCGQWYDCATAPGSPCSSTSTVAAASLLSFLP